MTARRHRTLNDLPLYASDEDIGEAVLGFTRRKEFRGLATLREMHGMPPICTLWGGRYVPAVKAYLDFSNGLGGTRPLPLSPGGAERPWIKQPERPDGVEGPWPIPTRKRKLTPPR